MKVLAITQARSGSTRLPDKVLLKIRGESLLEIHIKSIAQSTMIDQLVIATTIAKEDVAIVDIAKKNNMPHFRGSVNNVLDRFYQAAKIYHPEWVVRLTSDCPLIDAQLIDEIVDTAIKQNVDYCSNTLNPTFPDGMDVEVFKFSALKEAWNQAKLNSEKEHVTPYIHKNSSYHEKNLFTSYSFEGKENYADVRLTVDEPEDFKVIKLMVENLGTLKTWKEYTEYYLSEEKIKSLNNTIKRNEGYEKSLKKD